MTRQVMLNQVEHKNLRVLNQHGPQFGENVGTVTLLPNEYAAAQREYPIFFRKDANTGEYQSIALLGFSKDENLFLDGDRWDAAYLPAVIARGPFLIGYQKRQEGGESRVEPVIYVDVEDSRISQSEGERLFLEQGGNSRYLDRVGAILNAINEGLTMSKAMIAAFTSLELIEPTKVEVTVNATLHYELLGLHTISERKLRNLGADALYELHRSGNLQSAYLMLASINNVERLIDRKRRRAQPQAAMAS
jgi:hypothetical protein